MSLAYVLPDRALGREMSRVLEVGYVRGADLWHLACALYLVEDPPELSFITLDERQGAIAVGVGFETQRRDVTRESGAFIGIGGPRE